MGETGVYMTSSQFTSQYTNGWAGDLNVTTNITALNYSTTTAITSASFIPPLPPYNTVVTTILALLAGITSFCTTVGNIMVVISFALERSIRQPSNYLIASLAVTDILIGSLSMPLYTLYLLKSYWPLGQIVCDIWLSLDYTVCLVSQYTVFLITLDRFCSVKVPAKYRNWRTKRKIKIMIAVTWIVPALIFFTSIIGWHHFVKTAQPQLGVCMAMFQQNPLFSAILVISYYWVTLIIMFVLYVVIYNAAWTLHVKAKQTKERIRKATQNGGKKDEKLSNGYEKGLDSGYNTPGITPSTNTSNEIKDNQKTEVIPDQRKLGISEPLPEHKISTPNTLQINQENIGLINGETKKLQVESPIWKPRNSLPNTSIHWDAFTGKTHHAVGKTVEDVDNVSISSRSPKSPRSQRSQKSQGSDNYDSNSETSDSETKPKVIHQLTSIFNNIAQQRKLKTVSRSSNKSKSENRAKKALKTITFILGAFVICWTPYHVIVLIVSFCSDPNSCVNTKLYEFSYWLCYMNSPINPFCYALANQQFKKAFTKILKGEYIRDWWQKRK